MNAFERQVAGETVRAMGPMHPVDDLAIYNAAIQSPKWRFQPMFSATKFVVAAAIVALFGGFLLVSQPFEQRQKGVPGAAPTDPGTFSPAGSLAEGRGWPTATLLSDGRVLIVGGSFGDGVATAEVWDPETATFSPAGSLAEPRHEPSATLLLDGRVLVMGGCPAYRCDDDLASAEVWDPATGTFSPAGSLSVPRDDLSATLLPDGRVLVLGGCPSDNRCDDDLASVEAEVWDPATATFSPAGSLAEARPWPSATLLPDGRVLVIGGEGAGGAEVWDPGTSTFSPAGSSAMGWVADAVLLPDGRVFVVGGIDQENVTAEIWDPGTSTFSPAGSPAMRWVNLAGLLPDGRVLVAGGGLDVVAIDGDQEYVSAAAEIWDPATGTFSPAIPAGSLPEDRSYGSITLLPDGRVLRVGACIGHYCERRAPTSAEIWDPATGYVGPTGSLAEEHRCCHSATLLADGRVLVVGGDDNGDGIPLASAEVWDPSGG